MLCSSFSVIHVKPLAPLCHYLQPAGGLCPYFGAPVLIMHWHVTIRIPHRHSNVLRLGAGSSLTSTFRVAYLAVLRAGKLSCWHSSMDEIEKVDWKTAKTKFECSKSLFIHYGKQVQFPRSHHKQSQTQMKQPRKKEKARSERRAHLRSYLFLDFEEQVN